MRDEKIKMNFIWILLMIILLFLGTHRISSIKGESRRNQEIYLVDLEGRRVENKSE